MKRFSKTISLISVIFMLFVSMMMTGCATPLLTAASKGDINTVKDLLDKGADVNTQAAKDLDWTALMDAAQTGHIAVVKLLIEKGADVNAKDRWGRTVLSWAAWGGHIAVVKLLIEKGADIDSAIVRLESIDDPKFKAGAKMLERLRPKQEIASQPVTIVSKSSQEVSPTIKSDIDELPIFVNEHKIIGDKDIAIVIGIEKYQGLPKSDYSSSDAKLIKSYFKSLGFADRNIEFITDERATKSSIEKSLEAWLPNRIKKDSKVIIYYSGHGAPDPSTGDAYLVPFDGDPNYLEVTGYPLKRLYDKLGNLQVAEVIVLLDSCFSGAGGRSVLAKGARPLVMTTTALSIPSNMAILSATQGSQISTSSPEKGHGVFTYYFLKALKDGKKDIAEIYEYIKPMVEDEAKQLNVQQSPSINPDIDKLKGRFGLRK
jgi:hypothetical protein